MYWAVVLPPEMKHAAISSLIADYLYTMPHVHVLSEITGLPDHWNPQQLDGLLGVELLLDRLKKSRSNTEFLLQVNKTAPGGNRDDA